MSNVQLKSETFVINNISYLIRSLKDNQQFDDHDESAKALGISSATWPLFGIVWPTSVIMASRLFELELEGKRILEIGCGIGLCSIVLHRTGVDITASDYHPQTRSFLDRNIVGNGLPPIKYQAGNWETENPELGKFDVVIGSDILYQPAHAQQVSRFIDRHSNDGAQVVIGDPGRENRALFTKCMIALGYSHHFVNFNEQVGQKTQCKGRILHYQRD